MKFLTSCIVALIFLASCSSSGDDSKASNKANDKPSIDANNSYQEIPESEPMFEMFDQRIEKCWKERYMGSDYVEPSACFHADYEVVSAQGCGYKQDGLQYLTIESGFTTYCLKSIRFVGGDQTNYNINIGEFVQGYYIHAFGSCDFAYIPDDFFEYYDIWIDGRPYCGRR